MPLSVVKETAAEPPVQEAPPQIDDFEEIFTENVAQEPPVAPGTPAYTSDTPVETILSLITLDEARNYVVKEGACSGWTLAQVEERRPGKFEVLCPRLFRSGQYSSRFCEVIIIRYAGESELKPFLKIHLKRGTDYGAGTGFSL